MFEIYLSLVRYAETIFDKEYAYADDEGKIHFARRRVFREDNGVETTVLLEDGVIVEIIE